MDVQRHLRHEPVLARPDSRGYRMRKFVRRHRGPVTFAAIVFIALLGGLTGTITQAQRATRHAALAETQRQRADEQARAVQTQRDFALRQLSRAEAINDLNVFLLSDAAPSGKPFTVGDLLARAEALIGNQTGDSAENRVELLISIGHQYEILEQHGKARELLGQAYELSRGLTEPSIRAKAAAALSVSVALAGQVERGEALIQEALRELGDAPQFVLHRVFALLRGSRVARESGNTALGIERAAAAENLLRDSGQGGPLLDLTIAMEVAESYRMAGSNRQAADAFADAFQTLSALGRAGTEKAGTLLNNWANAVESLGQLLEAERLYRRAMEISTVDGNEETVSPMLLNNLARTLNELHRFDEAAGYAERAFARAQREGDEHVINHCLNVRTSIYRQQGNLDRAAEMLAQFEAKTKELLPADHVAVAVVAAHKAMLALARGEEETALAEANRAVAMVETKYPSRRPFMLLRRAEVHLRAGRYDSARADAERALTAEPGGDGSRGAFMLERTRVSDAGAGVAGRGQA